MSMKKSGGFTLIELIVVIVIIGILAAIAIPRFINQTTNARIAALNGLVGAFNSAAVLAQANYNASGGTGTTTSMNGTSVAVVSGTGYPAASAGGIGTATTISGFTAGTTSGTAGSGTATITYNFPTTVANCNVIYSEASGTASATTSGC